MTISRCMAGLMAGTLLSLATALPSLAQSRQLPIEAAATRLAAQQPERPGQRIVGGMQAIPGSYPFQVALVLSGAPQGQEFAGFFCGGTLIGDRHVLTAAHCFLSKEGGDDVVASDVHVYLGQTNFRGGERIPVKTLTRHPQWNAVSLVNDIAVLELERAPAAGTRASQIALAQPEAKLAPAVRVIGWGALDQGAASSRALREVGLNLVDHKTCTQTHTAWREKMSRTIIGEVATMIGLSKASEDKIMRVISEGAESPVGEKVVCAGADIGHRSPCYGDSGGPLFSEGEDGKPVQLGVVSWGIGCRTRDVYGVFTDVAKYGDWVKDVTKR